MGTHSIDLDRDAYALNKVMEFDHVIRVNDDGTVSDSWELHVPELHVTEDGADIFDGSGWSLLNGYSGQSGYAGPVMHASEFIGGAMARDILSEPGVYVAIVAYCLDSDDTAGWAVARKDA